MAHFACFSCCRIFSVLRWCFRLSLAQRSRYKALKYGPSILRHCEVHREHPLRGTRASPNSAAQPPHRPPRTGRGGAGPGDDDADHQLPERAPGRGPGARGDPQGGEAEGPARARRRPPAPRGVQAAPQTTETTGKSTTTALKHSKILKVHYELYTTR